VRSTDRLESTDVPPIPLILRCRASGLEGGLQKPQREREVSFEAASQHLRMRGMGIDDAAAAGDVP
jgi:hypothetical protein